MPKFIIEWKLTHFAQSIVIAKNKAEAKQKALSFNDFDYAELDEPKQLEVHSITAIERNCCGDKKTNKKGCKKV